jgi:hypothetical protein
VIDQPDATGPTAAIPGAAETYPALFIAADATALEGQRWFKLLTWAELGFLALGAAAAPLIVVAGGSEREVGLAAGAAFLLALIARLVVGARHDDHAWFDGRALAETVKSEAWRYVMRVPPFADDATADRTFVRHLRSAMRARLSLRAVVEPDAADSQITPWMRASRRLAVAERRDLYLRMRLHDQARWYQRSARRDQRAARRWSGLAIGAEAAAIIVAVLSATSEPISRLGIFGLCGSLAAAFTAINQLGRHAESARAYGLAYHELLTIASLADTVDSEDELATIVQDGEGAISREHTMWMAKRAEPLEISASEP